MKKTFAVALLILMAFVVIFPVFASAETYDVPIPAELAQPGPTEALMGEVTPDPSPSPWTWGYLATIAGATAATLLITQYLKVPLDKVWKIPTRLFVYLLALAIMVVATAYTSGITPNSFLLSVLNAFIVALAAYGSYELTFARADRA